MIERLMRQAAARPSATFIRYGDDSWDFLRVASLVQQGAAWLDRQGIAAGDKVVLAVGNRPLFIFCWLSVITRGAVAVPVSPDLFGKPLAYVVGQSEARLVLSDTGAAAQVREVAASLGVDCVAFADEAAFAAAVAPPPSAPSAASVTMMPLRDDAVVSILYTSGTTGEPKGVVISNRCYCAIGERIVDGIGITEHDRILTVLPLHHANPQMYSVMSALTAGCSVALASRFSASNFLAQVAHYQATGFTYVGTVLGILAKTLAEPAATSLRWCVGGGAPHDIWDDLAAKLGVTIHELYGMTETGGMVTMNTRERYRRGSVGVPRDDFEVVVLDDAERILPQGCIGEIAVRPGAPFVMTEGYYAKPRETLDALRNLWFHTGDRGRFDADGFLHFEGRKKELIRRGGEMVSPAEIEQVVLQHPGILDCAVVGVPDAILEEEIKLVLVARGAPGNIAPAAILAYLAGQLEKHKIPRYVDIVAEIPKTSTQKIQRFKLLAQSDDTYDARAACPRPGHPSA